ncbi:MAG TPA: PAS domain-containing protein, partial [Rhodoferax sp.]
MQHLRPARYVLLVMAVVLCTSGATAWLWRNVSHIEAALPLTRLQKERDSSALHFNLAQLEGALQLAAAVPDAAHVQQAAFALDQNLTRLADNQARHEASDKDNATQQQRLNGTLRELAQALAEPKVDTQRLELGLTELSRMRLEHQRLNDTIFQNSMDRVSQQHHDLAHLRDSMALLIGPLGLAGVLLFVLLLKKQRAIALLERQGEELRLQEKQLLIREREFRMLAENSPDPIVRYDRDGRRSYVNPALVRYSGVPASQLIGKSFSEHVPLLMSPASVALYETHIRKVLTTGQAAEWEI